METSSDDAERANDFYAVIDEFTYQEWIVFARRYMKLSSATIDDIKNNFREDVKEQKYQMVLSWKQKLGDTATPEQLKQLADESHHNSAGAPQSTISPHDVKYRNCMMGISKKLSMDDTTNLKRIYSNKLPSRQSFANAIELVFYLDDHNMLGEGINKLVALQENMKAIGREDICSDIKVMKCELQASKSAGDKIDASPFMDGLSPEDSDTDSEEDQSNTVHTVQSTGATSTSRTSQIQQNVPHPQSLTLSGVNVSNSVLNFGCGKVTTTYNYGNQGSNFKKYEKAGNSNWKKDKNNKK